MVQKCGGLPLAIVVLSGLLSRKRPSEWNDVCASLWRCLKDNSIHISTVFDLSFKEMRHELKLCFLYLSIFPEDYEINVENLLHLLVAEEFILEDEELMMEDVARHHIEELIDRSLVKAERIERGKVMSCKIHDLLRDVAIKKAKELNFVNVYNEQHSSTTCRRVAFHHHMDNNSLCNTRVNKRMRSFLFFGEHVDGFVELTNLKMKLLRVLSLGGLKFDDNSFIKGIIPDVIGDLIHLRYLGIHNNFLNHLPDFISNLRFLQTIDAVGNDFVETIDLRKLTSLRHLMGRFIGELKIGDEMNLQTLRSISSYGWSKLKHALLKNLRDLEINDEWIGQRRVPLELASFSKLKNLHVLRLEVGVLKLSSESDVIFPSLESLTLVKTTFEEDPMPVLQKSPRLEDLMLLGCDISGAKKMSISAQGFARLRKLKLNMKLDVLRIEKEAMPCLMKLELKIESKPSIDLMIPDRFRDLNQRN